MSNVSVAMQNVSGTNSNSGFFFGGFRNENFGIIQVGWYAQGDGVIDGKVTTIDPTNEVIIIEPTQQFLSGQHYYFTASRVTPINNICFTADTPILTDSGIIQISEINPKIHTIRKKKINAVTKTVSTDKYLVCIEKDALGYNSPSKQTVISKNHLIMYKGKMVKAKYFVKYFENIKKIKYNGEILYNILLEQYDKMIVNNLIVETLDPTNHIAMLYNSQYTTEEKYDIVIQMNNCIMQNDKKTYDKIIRRLNK